MTLSKSVQRRLKAQGVLVLNIPLLCPSLNQWYAGVHWRKRKATADLWHKAVWILCVEGAIKPITKFPVIISTQTWYKPYRDENKFKRDASNCFPANKLAEDGLVKAGILPDDTTEYVSEHRTLTPVIVLKECDEQTIVTITEGT